MQLQLEKNNFHLPSLAFCSHGRIFITYYRQGSFDMSAERSLFWENKSTLIVADVHIGKTGHFRKSGINVPQSVV